MFASIAAWWALRGGLKGIIGNIPRWMWVVLAVVILGLLALWWHGRQVHNFKVETQRAQMAADNEHWKKKLAEAHQDALTWKNHYETEQAKRADEERKRHEQVLRDNAARADALRLSGPGAARSNCRPSNSPKAVAGASGSREAAAAPSTSSAGVSSEDWAVVPWRWLTNVVQQHDDLLDEALTWRNDKAKQYELYQQQTKGASEQR